MSRFKVSSGQHGLVMFSLYKPSRNLRVLSNCFLSSSSISLGDGQRMLSSSLSASHASISTMLAENEEGNAHESSKPSEIPSACSGLAHICLQSLTPLNRAATDRRYVCCIPQLASCSNQWMNVAQRIRDSGFSLSESHGFRLKESSCAACGPEFSHQASWTSFT